MAWIQIRINANANNADLISDLLVEAGSASVTFIDAKNTPIYEPKIGTVQFWADTTVIGLFDANHDMSSVVTFLHANGWIISTLFNLAKNYGFALAGAIFQTLMPLM
jgi:ribosomal protein L11 methyltransferase